MTDWRVALIGLRGSGKTSVGRCLAALLRVPFFDGDAAVLERTGRSSAEWLRGDGEAVFRDVERDVTGALARCPVGVLALGGGAPIDPRTRAALRGWQVVWLEAATPALVARVERDSLTERPALSAEPLAKELETQRRDREAIYAALQPCLRLATDVASVAEVARSIADHLQASELGKRESC
ncbi:MAG: shikimate kinase [Planctomycetota bacterium]